MKIAERVEKWLDKIFGQEVTSYPEDKIDEYWDFDTELRFHQDLEARVIRDGCYPDKNKPKVCIRTTKDVIYFLPENEPVTFTEEELHKINLVEVIAYWSGNGNEN